MHAGCHQVEHTLSQKKFYRSMSNIWTHKTTNEEEDDTVRAVS